MNHLAGSEGSGCTVVIVGLGYVGLPLAEAAQAAGHRVIGLDKSEAVTAFLNSGHSHVDDISDAQVGEMLRRGFVAATQEEVIQEADVVVICVPTPLGEDGNPDLTSVLSATQGVSRNMQAGAVVVLESTTYPGTTEELLLPILAAEGRVVGRDFYLAFSPERVDPGNAHYTIRNTPKVVGGVTPECLQAVDSFYGTFVEEVVRAKGTREAETAKLLENTYRHINIALVNELARVCHEMDIDVWDVIRCAGTKPFGFQAFYPGPGVGGHCIPIDPNYLGYAVRSTLGYPFRFVELAQEINQTMPAYVYRRIQDLLNASGLAVRGSRVLMVGVTYKNDIADQRESPAVDVFTHLEAAGAKVEYFDHLVEDWRPDGHRVPRVTELLRGSFDVAVVLQHHEGLVGAAVAECANVVLDCRGRLDGPNVELL